MSIDLKDWNFPTVPTPSIAPSFGPSFSGTSNRFIDDVSVSMPSVSGGPEKPFPDYAVINPEDILNGIRSLVTSFDKGVGIARELVPGVKPLGEALGALGRGIEQSPIGEPLGQFGKTVTGGVGSYIGDTLGAVGRRLGQIGGEVGRTFDPSNPDSWKFIDLPLRLAGAAALGETGIKAFDFGRPVQKGDLDFSNISKDLMDSVAIAGVVPAFKAAGMLAKGTEIAVPGFTRFAGGFGRAFLPTTGAGFAEKAGVVTGRAVLGLSAAGLAADFALPKIAPNEPWAKEILENRIVAEDSPWRTPYEIAITLPMDIFAATKFAANSKVASWARETVFGPATLPHSYVFTDDAVKNAIRSGIMTKEDVSLFNDMALRQYAEEQIVKDFNESRFLQSGDEGFAATSVDLPYTQKELNQRVIDYIPRLRSMGDETFYREAAYNFIRKSGWEGLGEAQIMREFTDYAKNALKIEPQMFGRVVGVNDVNAFFQAPRALEYLDSLKSFGLKEYNELVHTYPALNSLEDFVRAGRDINKIKLALQDSRQFLTAQKDEPAIASVRAQIRETEKAMDDIEQRFGREQREFVVGPDGKTTIKYPWKELNNELKVLEQRYAVLNAPSYFKLGAMEAEINRVADRLVSKPVDADIARYRELQKQIKAIREVASEEHLKTIKMKQGLIQSRISEIISERGYYDPDILDTELNMLENGVERATESYYNALMAGSRWHIEHSPKGPIMRLADRLPSELGLKLDPGLRTPAGKVFSTLFGSLPNIKLGREAWEKMRGHLAEGGSTEEGMNRLFQEAKDELDKWSWVAPGGFHSNAFVSIFHLPPQWFNKTAEQLNRTAGKIVVQAPAGMTVGEVVYRSYPGPFKIFAKQVFGKELPNLPYNALYHAVSRSFYPMVRFYLSPRFVAMNISEQNFIGGALGGPEFFVKEPNEWFVRIAKDMQEFEGQSSARFFERMDRKHVIRNVAKLAWTKRADEVVHGILDTVSRQPEMADLMKSMGSRDKWYDELYGMFRIREDIRNAKFQTTTELKTLGEQVQAKGEELAKVRGTGDELRVQSELRALTDQYDDVASKAVFQKDAEAIFGDKIDKYQPFLEAAAFNFREVVRAERRMFLGNPDRSATERLLNSFLLYWPISYQLKAGKIMAEFMFSRGLGFPAGSSGAAAWSQMRLQHEKKMNPADPMFDPEYRDFFHNNKNLLFLVQQFFPLTPEDVGATLSRYVKTPVRVIRGQDKLSRLPSMFDIGLAYDVDLATRVLNEQSKPTGLFHDIFGED